MLHAPPVESKVNGFTITVNAHPQNLASGNGDKGSHLLEDGFLHLAICCDGTNPFWPERFEETILIARLKHPGNMPDVKSDYELCLLQSDDQLRTIRLEETSFQGYHHGVWLIVECASPVADAHGGTLAYGTIIHATSEVFAGAHTMQ